MQLNIIKHISQPQWRRLGYLYETLTKKEIILPETLTAKREYSTLLDPSQYYTIEQSLAKLFIANQLESKWKIIDNSLGEIGVFCPMVRKTLATGIEKGLFPGFNQMLQSIPAAVRKRISHGLYNADSIASFKIEGEYSDSEVERIEKFTRVLKETTAKGLDFTESELTRIQNVCVNEDKRDNGYRTTQNAIGGKGYSLSYICPPPDHVKSMMGALNRLWTKALSSTLDPAAAAAAISGSFVLIHPFLDGNGRISRLLAGNILSRHVQNNVPFPLSMGIEDNRDEYISILSSQTSPIMKRTNYTIEDGVIKLLQADIDIYRYPDFTIYTEYIAKTAESTYRRSIPAEIKKLSAEILLETIFREKTSDLNVPDNITIDAVRWMADNGGRISKSKRKILRRYMSDDVIASVEDRYFEVLTSASTKLNSENGHNNISEEVGPCM